MNLAPPPPPITVSKGFHNAARSLRLLRKMCLEALKAILGGIATQAHVPSVHAKIDHFVSSTGVGQVLCPAFEGQKHIWARQYTKPLCPHRFSFAKDREDGLGSSKAVLHDSQ